MLAAGDSFSTTSSIQEDNSHPIMLLQQQPHLIPVVPSVAQDQLFSGMTAGSIDDESASESRSPTPPPAIPMVAPQAVIYNNNVMFTVSAKQNIQSDSGYVYGFDPSVLDGSMVTRTTPEIYSRKVFVGGLPIDITENEVYRTFSTFGNVYVDWPRRDNLTRDTNPRQMSRSMCGYAFLVFEDEIAVHHMISRCVQKNDRLYLGITSVTMKNKPVQVRPWMHSDTEYILDRSIELDARCAVFIGGLPRPTRAKDLAKSLSALYGPVVYVGIDIDPELKYPKGAARAVFATTASYTNALVGRFVHIDHAECNKRVEIKPYIMDEQMCDECEGQLCHYKYAPYYCPEAGCMQYYCESCWDRIHSREGRRQNHHVLVRIGDQTKILRVPPHHSQVQTARYSRCKH